MLGICEKAVFGIGSPHCGGSGDGAGGDGGGGGGGGGGDGDGGVGDGGQLKVPVLVAVLNVTTVPVVKARV